jgi:predicted glycosyltransferase involved in capsule biosynthesis
MRVILFFILGCIALPLTGQQFASDFWHSGRTVLDSGDTLRGSIKYDMQNDILQVQVDKKLGSFTARKVLLFEIFDETVKRYRTFYSLPYSQAGQYKAPVFFELLEEGKLTVLCRESLEYRTTSSSFYYYGNYTRLVLVNKYFILKENGDIEEFTGKKHDWYELMRAKANEVESYVKSNRLDFDDKYELGRIIAFYNSLYKK